MKFRLLSRFRQKQKTPALVKKTRKREIEKINTLLLNIETYDGTSARQKKIGGDIL